MYTDAFYDTIRDGCRQSAAVIAPIVHKLVAPSTVVDIGCGEGWWAAAFAELGCQVAGVDGPHVNPVAVEQFTAVDLEQPLPELGRFDLVVCLEVAEHLPELHAARFVADLCALAPTVLFSAAIPHQTGAGHVNCRWSSWWAVLFAEHGYRVSSGLRWRIWDDERVEPWYRQNLLLASKRLPRLPSAPLDVVHPTIHEWGR